MQEEHLIVGATKFDKGDLYIGQQWIIEAKTSMTPKKSFSIKREWLDKLKEEQYATGKDYRALCFDFGESSERFYVINEQTFLQLIDLINDCEG